MKLKKISLIALFSGLAILIIGLVLPFIYLPTHIANNGNIALIGGAEIPELLPGFMFWAAGLLGGLPLALIIIGVNLIIAAVVCFFVSKAKR